MRDSAVPGQVQEIGTRVQDALNIYRGQSQEEAAQAAELIRGLDRTTSPRNPWELSAMEGGRTVCTALFGSKTLYNALYRNKPTVKDPFVSISRPPMERVAGVGDEDSMRISIAAGPDFDISGGAALPLSRRA